MAAHDAPLSSMIFPVWNLNLYCFHIFFFMMWYFHILTIYLPLMVPGKNVAQRSFNRPGGPAHTLALHTPRLATRELCYGILGLIVRKERGIYVFPAAICSSCRTTRQQPSVSRMEKQDEKSWKERENLWLQEELLTSTYNTGLDGFVQVDPQRNDGETITREKIYLRRSAPWRTAGWSDRGLPARLRRPLRALAAR